LLVQFIHKRKEAVKKIRLYLSMVHLFPSIARRWKPKFQIYWFQMIFLRETKII